MDSTIELVTRYLAELRAWNIRSNLVAAGDHPRLVRRHVVESLACVTLLDRLGGRDLLDLGCGAGFPGIPIKLVRPTMRLALLEGRRMKSLFLRRAVGTLALERTVVWQARVETIAGLPPEQDQTAAAGDPGWLATSYDEPISRPQFDLITARAVAPLERVTQWIAPILRPGGHLVTFKGRSADAEIEAWGARPGPWSVAEVVRDSVPGLILVALKRLPSESTQQD